jgi:hypothetical protein
MAKGSCFSRYLERNREGAAKALLTKAYLANKIAKISVGKQRETLYELKGRFLSSALKLTPTSFLVDSQTQLGGSNLLVGITTNVGFRFHVIIKENAGQVGVFRDGRNAEHAA